MKKISILAFSFEELNSMALCQGFIHELRTLDKATHWLCLVPPGFKSLAFASDSVVEYPDHLMKYGSYNEVANLTDAKWSKLRRFIYDLKRSIGSIGLAKWQHRVGSKKFWAAIAASPRATKFYWTNLGLQKWILNLERNLSEKYDEVEYWPINDLLLIGEGFPEYKRVSLERSFRERFRSLEKAIRNGLVFSAGQDAVPDVPKHFESPDVLIRTRNYSAKQQEHNTDLTALKRLVESLLGSGFTVVQSGLPALPLCIVSDNYLEVSNLTLDAEMALLGDGDTVVYSEGGAGLFSLMACLSNQVRLLSPEWSVNNFDPPISLMDARKYRDKR